jgi:ABC-type Na+ efflux pump permease subunit
MMPWLLLRSMILKELRTTLREKHQFVGLAISIIAMTAGVAVPAMNGRSSLASKIVTNMSWTPEMIAIAKWIPMLVGVGVGVFFGMGFLLAAVMSSFASEKENRTLELALVSPVSDTRLFLAKCISVLLPSMALGGLFTTVIAVVAQFTMGEVLRTLPFAWWFYLVVLSMPMTLMPCTILVGLGAAISARSETAKGAGQVMGGVFVGLILGPTYGIPLLVRFTGLGDPVMKLLHAWLSWPFAAQYASLLLAAAIPAVLAVFAGRLMFRRDRLLT